MNSEFSTGELVEVLHRDGQSYRGYLLWFDSRYFIITPGIGFPHEDIVWMINCSA